MYSLMGISMGIGLLFDIANKSFKSLENPFSINNDEYYQPYISNNVAVVTNNAYKGVSELTLPEDFKINKEDRELLNQRITALAKLNNEVETLYAERPTSGGRRKNRLHKKRHTRHTLHKAKKNQRKTRRRHHKP